MHLSRPLGKHSLHSALLPFCLLAVGLFVRVVPAYSNFLNPDEAQHYLLSAQPALRLAYQASLATAHPPLLILLLHYWSVLGKSELILRMPSVLAGTAFCWVMSLWLETIAGRGAALSGLALLLFSPPLIQLSAEVRQYALLLFFMAGCLYLFDRSIEEYSANFILLAFLALDLAILTHYSAFIFAFVFGIYSLLRLRSAKPKAAPAQAWMLGQLSTVGLSLFLLISHVSRLEKLGMPELLANTYHSSAIFHSDRDRLLPFIVRASSRLFGYLAGSKAIGAVEFLALTVGIALLFSNQKPGPDGRLNPTPRQLGLLLALPFVINCAVALAGRYPFGGTRHNIFLAPFAISGVAIAVALWKTSKPWLKPAAVGTALAVCNLFPAPVGPYILPENQKRQLMAEAANFLRQSVPPGSVIFTDGQGGFLLSYYLCSRPVVQLTQPSSPFLESPCGSDDVITPNPDLFIFQPDTLPPAMEAMEQTYGLKAGRTVWLVRAGWLVNQQPVVEAQLRQLGCGSPEDFGANISVCHLRLEERDLQAENRKRASRKKRA
jgi:hypothetical protein